MENDEDCTGCIYAKVTFDDEDGMPLMKCRRYPPTIVIFADEIAQSFPDAHERCGEYRGEDG